MVWAQPIPAYRPGRRVLPQNLGRQCSVALTVAELCSNTKLPQSVEKKCTQKSVHKNWPRFQSFVSSEIFWVTITIYVWFHIHSSQTALDRLNIWYGKQPVDRSRVIWGQPWPVHWPGRRVLPQILGRRCSVAQLVAELWPNTKLPKLSKKKWVQKLTKNFKLRQHWDFLSDNHHLCMIPHSQ